MYLIVLRFDFMERSEERRVGKESLRLTEEEAKGKDSYEQTRLLFNKYLKTIEGTDMTMEENGSLGVRCLDQQTHLAAIQWSLFHASEVCACQELLIKERFF